MFFGSSVFDENSELASDGAKGISCGLWPNVTGQVMRRSISYHQYHQAAVQLSLWDDPKDARGDVRMRVMLCMRDMASRSWATYREGCLFPVRQRVTPRSMTWWLPPGTKSLRQSRCLLEGMACQVGS